MYFKKGNFNDHDASTNEPAPAAIWGWFVHLTAHFDSINVQADGIK